MPTNLQTPRSYSGISTGNGDVSPGVSFLSTSATGGGGGGAADENSGGFDVPAHRKVNRYARVEFVNDVFEVVT
jgi:hypothetical protein